jgi:hypothetical protein
MTALHLSNPYCMLTGVVTFIDSCTAMAATAFSHSPSVHELMVNEFQLSLHSVELENPEH